MELQFVHNAHLDVKAASTYWFALVVIQISLWEQMNFAILPVLQDYLQIVQVQHANLVLLIVIPVTLIWAVFPVVQQSTTEYWVDRDVFPFKDTTKISHKLVLNAQLVVANVQVVFCVPHVQVDFCSIQVEYAQIPVHSDTIQIL